MKRLKIGVVGAGIGKSHIQAFATMPDRYEVVSLCDIDRDRAQQVAGELGVPHTDGRFEDLLDRDLDVIDVGTPSKLHVPQTLAALEAGFDVIVEKPAGQSLADMDRLAAAEQKTGQRIAPVFQYRFGHGIQKLHHLVAKGVAGRPLMATSETHWLRRDGYYDASPWRGTWEGETGGTFATHAIHIHDLLCEVMGPIRSLHARASNSINGNETEDNGVVSFGFENGAMASASVTVGSRQQMSRLRFVFENLVAESGLSPYNPGHEPWTFPHDDPEEEARIAQELGDFQPRTERFPGLFERIHLALTAGSELPVTLDDARRSIELLTAIYWSSDQDMPVTFPIKPDHPFYNGWIEHMKLRTQNG